MREIMHSLVVHALVLVFICPTAFLLRLLLLRIGGLDESSDDGLKEQLEDRPQGEPSIQSEEVPSKRPEKRPEKQSEKQSEDQQPQAVRRWVLPSSKIGRPLDRHLWL